MMHIHYYEPGTMLQGREIRSTQFMSSKITTYIFFPYEKYRNKSIILKTLQPRNTFE